MKILKQKMIISRHWNNPEIEVTVMDTGISIIVSLDDFMIALEKELTLHPLQTLTAARRSADLRAAKNIVLTKMKEASTYVV